MSFVILKDPPTRGSFGAAGAEIPPSGAIIQGRAWHEALEANYSQKINSDTDLPLDDMQGIFTERFDENIEQEEIAFQKDENPGSLKDQGVTIVETHHNAIAPTVHPVMVEQEFRVSPGEEFPYHVRGHVPFSASGLRFRYMSPYWDLVDRESSLATKLLWLNRYVYEREVSSCFTEGTVTEEGLVPVV